MMNYAGANRLVAISDDLPDGRAFENLVKPTVQKYFCFSEAKINAMFSPVPRRQ
jgi:hypothetical protein